MNLIVLNNSLVNPYICFHKRQIAILKITHHSKIMQVNLKIFSIQSTETFVDYISRQFFSCNPKWAFQNMT